MESLQQEQPKMHIQDQIQQIHQNPTSLNQENTGFRDPESNNHHQQQQPPQLQQQLKRANESKNEAKIQTLSTQECKIEEKIQTLNTQECKNEEKIQTLNTQECKNEEKIQTLNTQEWKNEEKIETLNTQEWKNDEEEEKREKRSDQSGENGGNMGPRERLKRHRREVAGQVWIPDMWGQEDFLKDWIDCSAFDAALMPQGIMLARASLIQQGRRTSNSNTTTLRLENTTSC